MFVMALAIVLASNNTICEKFCDTDQYEQRLQVCQGTVEELQKDVDYCKAAFHRVGAAYKQSLADGELRCAQKLAACEAKKRTPKKKVVVPPKKEEPKVCGCPTCCAVPPPVVNVTIVNTQAQATVVESVSLWHRERPNWLLGVRGAIGTAFCAPQGIGLVGVRANYLPIHLGADVYTEFFHGTGAQLLIYPVQFRTVMWHVNGGAIWFNQRPFLLPSLPRQVDLTLGTGLELRVLPFLWVTADLVVRMPNPVAIAATGEQFSAVFGKSLVQTQGMLGLMLRTW